jgi:hypothetical protein
MPEGKGHLLSMAAKLYIFKWCRQTVESSACNGESITSTARRKYPVKLSYQGFTLVGPLERLGHSGVVVVNEGQNLGFQFIERREGASSEQFANKNAEPDLNLIEPGTMLRCVVKDNAMGGVTEKGGPGLFVEQDTRFAFLSQVDIQIGFGSHPAHQGLRLMNVEIIENEVPALGRRLGGDHGLEMGQEISFSPGFTRQRCDQLTGHHVSTQDERSRAVANVLELTAFDFARGHGQSWMFPFQRLHPGQLICADGSLSLLMALGCSAVGLAHVSHFGVKVRIVRWRQPVADAVGLQIPFFSSLWACRGDIVSTIPRRVISSAISQPLHWLMGRPDFSDASHANAVI